MRISSARDLALYVRDRRRRAAVAADWAETAAAARRLPAVPVTDILGEHHGRHTSPRSSRLDFRPGAVIAHVSAPTALDLAIRLANGTALAVIEHPHPWGWVRGRRPQSPHRRDRRAGPADLLRQQRPEPTLASARDL